MPPTDGPRRRDVGPSTSHTPQFDTSLDVLKPEGTQKLSGVSDNSCKSIQQSYQKLTCGSAKLRTAVVHQLLSLVTESSEQEGSRSLTVHLVTHRNLLLLYSIYNKCLNAILVPAGRSWYFYSSNFLYPILSSPPPPPPPYVY